MKWSECRYLWCYNIVLIVSCHNTKVTIKWATGGCLTRKLRSLCRLAVAANGTWIVRFENIQFLSCFFKSCVVSFIVILSFLQWNKKQNQNIVVVILRGIVMKSHKCKRMQKVTFTILHTGNYNAKDSTEKREGFCNRGARCHLPTTTITIELLAHKYPGKNWYRHNI